MKNTLAPECQVHAKHFLRPTVFRGRLDVDVARERENAHRFSINRVKRNAADDIPSHSFSTRLVHEHWDVRVERKFGEERRGYPVGALCKNTHTRLFTERVGKLGHGQSRNEWPFERRVSRYSSRCSSPGIIRLFPITPKLSATGETFVSRQIKTISRVKAKSGKRGDSSRPEQ